MKRIIILIAFGLNPSFRGKRRAWTEMAYWIKSSIVLILLLEEKGGPKITSPTFVGETTS